MNIDERIEKLTERHEALAHSVELLTLNIEGTRQLVNAMVAGITSLTVIVRNHEERIERIEEQ